MLKEGTGMLESFFASDAAALACAAATFAWVASSAFPPVCEKNEPRSGVTAPKESDPGSQ